MRARAALAVQWRGGRSVVTTLRAQAPLALVPRRGATAAARPAAEVHLVGSAATPLAGDDVEIEVTVGPGASLLLTGVAAAVALPGAGRPSRTLLRCRVDEDASLIHRPEPTVVTGRADHHTVLDVELAPTASLRARDVLVAGRTGERPGRYRGTVRITDGGRPLLVQTQEVGDPLLDGSAAHLAGHRVLGTEVVIGTGPAPEPMAGDGWSVSPLPVRGALATAVAHDAVTAQRRLAAALARLAAQDPGHAPGPDPAVGLRAG
ncbi:MULTISPECIES: urease accessory protein UreD [Pseudonocardia]|uniref:Urease accessory protein UreD n=2 Tax=Pseudonocardia TaxID=1847 RepID=A0A1Y2N732_PSEAH|nr:MULTISPECIES: urease accessory protein UreD [Pseudonocardia]OSY43270.1 Urease accessory protein UreD [Pseudonocardia autotrophica]TDN71758.1 urease accessory protein [Pseudonocardia autotrophica]BBG02445.1 urease accessory protein UreD [Pseudonocardia autotrophica]GEC23219.1 urease accessory protein UreD [Pseudonocardia saturnea]